MTLDKFPTPARVVGPAYQPKVHPTREPKPRKNEKNDPNPNLHADTKPHPAEPEEATFAATVNWPNRIQRLDQGVPFPHSPPDVRQIEAHGTWKTFTYHTKDSRGRHGHEEVRFVPCDCVSCKELIARYGWTF